MANTRSRRPESLNQRVAARLAPLLSTEGNVSLRLRLAYSGGLDSSVLLHVFAGLAKQLPLEIQACHVHHGLSAQADAWCEHCRQVCAVLQVPLEVVHVDVPRDDRAGLEGAARQARYQALNACAADWLVLAHHADDQAETLLFRLCRGAGVTGAACMREIDPLQRQLRPLLGESRASLESYAHEQGLRWVEDDSNPELRFARNYLRHQVLAPLRLRFPAASSNLARSSAIFAESDQLLSELGQEDSVRIRVGQAGSRERFRALSQPRARNLLRFWLRAANPQLPEMARLDAGLLQLSSTAAIRWVYGLSAVCAYRDRVWIEPAQIATPEPFVWQGEVAVSWAGGVLRIPPMFAPQGALRIGFREEGMFWRLGPGRPRRAFKQLCQDAEVPPWWRDLLPCIWQGEELRWIGGLQPLQGTRVDFTQPEWDGGWRYFQQVFSPC